MFGSSSSAPPKAQPLSLTVHGLPVPGHQAKKMGRLHMVAIGLVCVAPVVASYFTYYVIRPQGRLNYSTLIEPQQPVPAGLALTNLQGLAVASATLKNQWLLVVVASGACDNVCEKMLYLQRQLRESLGAEKDRVDKVWLIPDAEPVPDKLLAAINPVGAPTTVLRVPLPDLAQWLKPASEQALGAHFYIVDPMGHWMMRSPPNPDPAKLKRDLDKLLRASRSWDTPGR